MADLHYIVVSVFLKVAGHCEHCHHVQLHFHRGSCSILGHAEYVSNCLAGSRLSLRRDLHARHDCSRPRRCVLPFNTKQSDG
jgi:hypothetical protein